MILFFIYDEFTDKVDGDGARLYAEMVMDAIRNPHKESQSSAKFHDSMFCVLTNVAYLADKGTVIDFGCVPSRFRVLRPRNASFQHSQNMCMR